MNARNNNNRSNTPELKSTSDSDEVKVFRPFQYIRSDSEESSSAAEDRPMACKQQHPNHNAGTAQPALPTALPPDDDDSDSNSFMTQDESTYHYSESSEQSSHVAVADREPHDAEKSKERTDNIAQKKKKRKKKSPTANSKTNNATAKKKNVRKKPPPATNETPKVPAKATKEWLVYGDDSSEEDENGNKKPRAKSPKQNEARKEKPKYKSIWASSSNEDSDSKDDDDDQDKKPRAKKKSVSKQNGKKASAVATKRKQVGTKSNLKDPPIYSQQTTNVADNAKPRLKDPPEYSQRTSNAAAASRMSGGGGVGSSSASASSRRNVRESGTASADCGSSSANTESVARRPLHTTIGSSPARSVASLARSSVASNQSYTGGILSAKKTRELDNYMKERIEQWAKEKNVPKSKLIQDKDRKNLALAVPTSKDELQADKVLRKGVQEKYGQQIVELIQEFLRSNGPSIELVQRRRKERQNQDKRKERRDKDKRHQNVSRQSNTANQPSTNQIIEISDDDSSDQDETSNVAATDKNTSATPIESTSASNADRKDSTNSVADSKSSSEQAGENRDSSAKLDSGGVYDDAGMSLPMAWEEIDKAPQMPPVAPDTEKKKNPIEKIGPHDVLFGRGGLANGNLGNAWLRELVQRFRFAYFAAPRGVKRAVSKSIVNYVRSKQGRFLEMDKSSWSWHEVGDEKAFDKLSQLLKKKVVEEPSSSPAKQSQSTSSNEKISRKAQKISTSAPTKAHKRTREERDAVHPKLVSAAGDESEGVLSLPDCDTSDSDSSSDEEPPKPTSRTRRKSAKRARKELESDFSSLDSSSLDSSSDEEPSKPTTNTRKKSAKRARKEPKSDSSSLDSSSDEEPSKPTTNTRKKSAKRARKEPESDSSSSHSLLLSSSSSSDDDSILAEFSSTKKSKHKGILGAEKTKALDDWILKRFKTRAQIEKELSENIENWTIEEGTRKKIARIVPTSEEHLTRHKIFTDVERDLYGAFLIQQIRDFLKRHSISIDTIDRNRKSKAGENVQAQSGKQGTAVGPDLNLKQNLLGLGYCYEWIDKDGKKLCVYGTVTEYDKSHSEKKEIDTASDLSIRHNAHSRCLLNKYHTPFKNLTVLEHEPVSTAQAWGGCLLYQEKQDQMHPESTFENRVPFPKEVAGELVPMLWRVPDLYTPSTRVQKSAKNMPSLCLNYAGFQLEFTVKPSTIPNSGNGVFLSITSLLDDPIFSLQPGEILDIGVYAPLTAEDETKDHIMMVRSILQSCWCDSYSMNTRISETIFDITHGRGKLTREARKSILPFVNESDEWETHRSEIQMVVDPQGSYHYALGYMQDDTNPGKVPAFEWLADGKPREVFVDYGRIYEMNRIRHGYCRESLIDDEQKQKLDQDEWEKLDYIWEYTEQKVKDGVQCVYDFVKSGAMERVQKRLQDDDRNDLRERALALVILFHARSKQLRPGGADPLPSTSTDGQRDSRKQSPKMNLRKRTQKICYNDDANNDGANSRRLTAEDWLKVDTQLQAVVDKLRPGSSPSALLSTLSRSAANDSMLEYSCRLAQNAAPAAKPSVGEDDHQGDPSFVNV